jgi:hypothetical protein
VSSTRFLGALITAPIILAIWYTNTWNTAYIAINDNHVWDNTGSRYKVLRVVDNDTTLFNEEGYQGILASLPLRWPGPHLWRVLRRLHRYHHPHHPLPPS